MKYLLDVNVLVAFGLLQHDFHGRVAAWVHAQSASTLGTCSITELGFVRIISQLPAYGFTVIQAQAELLRLKETNGLVFKFIPDNLDISHLPQWVERSKQTTDGHLVALAASNGALLATLDEKIPGSFLIR